VPKWCKTIVALALLPCCIAALTTLQRVVQHSGRAETVWVALLSGAACWWAVFLLLPKPMRLYVFGHEFTHVLWTWLFGGEVKAFRVSANGGHVIVTKDNFLIALAPYFFPLYAVAVIVIFVLGHWLWDWSPYVPWFHLLLGAAYAFHVTLTWHILQARQSDITDQGYLFSAVVIFLGNITVLLIAIPLVTQLISPLQVFGWWVHDAMAIWSRLIQIVSAWQGS
jgi:hypothetical protein